MMISIIIPAYNSQSTIKKAILSVIDNDYANDLEIIVVINASSDNTLKICKEMAEEYQNIKIYETYKIGVSHARNIGLSKCKGDIVGFCDSDDYYAKGWKRAVLNEYAKHPNTCIICTGYNYVDIDGKLLSRKKFKIPKNINMEKFACMCICDNKVMGSVWNKFYKRQILNNIAFGEMLTHCEDMYFNYQIYNKNKNCSVRLLNFTTYNYLYNHQSVTSNNNLMFDDNDNLSYFKALNLILSNKPNKKIIKSVYVAKYLIALKPCFSRECTVTQKLKLKKIVNQNYIPFCSYIPFYLRLSFYKYSLYYPYAHIKEKLWSIRNK